MMNDSNDAPLVEKPRRNAKKWKKSGGDGFSGKARKQWKNRERRLQEEGYEEELREYK